MALPTRVNRGSQLDTFDTAHHEFDYMLSQLLGGRPQVAPQYWAPYGVDIHEDADHIIVEAELPGFTKDQVNITMENQTLTISAQHKENQNRSQSTSGDKAEWLLRERRYSRFQRSFTLPPTVDAQSVEATLNDGVLTIVLNKREETKPRRIPVA